MMPRKMSDLGTMPEKIMKSEQALEKGPSRHRKRVRAGTEKGRIRANSGKVESGKYQKGGIHASTGQGRIRESAGKVESE